MNLRVIPGKTTISLHHGFGAIRHKIPGIGGIQNAQTEGPKTKDSFLIYPGQSPRFANAIFTFVWVAGNTSS